MLVFFEFFGLGLVQCDGEGGDGVVVGPALVAGEDGGVDFFFEVVGDGVAFFGGGAHAFAEEDHGAAWTAEGFVGSGCDDVGVGEGGGDDVASDETGNVGHVGEEIGAAGIGDFFHACVVDEAGVGGCAGDDDFGAVEGGVGLELVVVDETGRFIEAIGEGFEVFGDHADFLGGCLVAMR